MNQLLIVILILIAIGTGVFLFPIGASAVLIGGLMTALAIIVINAQLDDRDFLLKVFLIGMILRVLSAIFINLFRLQEFFGPDALYYDFLGENLANYWLGNLPANFPPVAEAMNSAKSGFGMNYFVGAVYFITGQNMLAMQFFCTVLGAATAVVTYLCSKEIFSNTRVARISAWIVTLSPSLILWSSQALKDGIIVFLLVLSVVTVIRMQRKFDYLSFVILMFSLVAIISLRFYIFYMLIVGIVGCFAIGSSQSSVSVLRRVMVLLVIGLALTSIGGSRTTDVSQFNLEKVQETREDLARGNAGFRKDLDVSTTEGALIALPIGFSYLMFAPFPWQLGNLRQAITMPEMLLWWASMPFLVSGLFYTIRHRLRQSISVLLFTLMLTLAYSLYQGNVGTAYRQRAQIQIFHFMFIAAGYVVWQEKKENERLLKISRKNRQFK